MSIFNKPLYYMIFYIVLIFISVVFLIFELIIRIRMSNISFYPSRIFDKKCNMYKFKPFQKGKYNVPGKNFVGQYRINNEGWNSLRDYFKERKKNINRIACIGSSNTIAFEINIEDSYTQIIENTLNNIGIKNEVYTFGVPVISIAQVLHLVRIIVKDYSPDIITITSYSLGGLIISSPTKSEFMTLSVSSTENIKEILPNINVSFIIRICRLSFLLKYLNKKYDIRKKIVFITSRFNSKSHQNLKNINISATRHNNSYLLQKYPSYKRKYDIALRYIYNQLNYILAKHNVKPLFIFYPQSFYSCSNDGAIKLSEESEGRMQTKSLLNEYSLPYFDLTETYVKDYETNRIKFAFVGDTHFNEYGHKVMGEAIAKFLIENKYFEDKPL